MFYTIAVNFVSNEYIRYRRTANLPEIFFFYHVLCVSHFLRGSLEKHKLTSPGVSLAFLSISLTVLKFEIYIKEQAHNSLNDAEGKVLLSCTVASTYDSGPSQTEARGC